MEKVDFIKTFIIPLASAAIAATISLYIAKRNLRNAQDQTYQKLEFESIALFRFEAANAEIVAKFYNETELKWNELSEEDTVKMESYITQVLNLFEIAVTYRNNKIFPRDKFATWVPWFYEVCESPTFQFNWEPEFKDHYSEILAELLDSGIDLIKSSSALDDSEKLKNFIMEYSRILDNDQEIEKIAKRICSPRTTRVTGTLRKELTERQASNKQNEIQSNT